MESPDDMFREELLEHYRHPQNAGKIEKADVKFREVNPLCGDEIEIFANIKGGKVADIKFDGKGCAISQAAASILTEKVKGHLVKSVKKITNEKMLEMLPVKVSHLRMKCGLLAL